MIIFVFMITFTVYAIITHYLIKTISKHLSFIVNQTTAWMKEQEKINMELTQEIKLIRERTDVIGTILFKENPLT